MPFTCTHPSAQTYRKSAEMDQNINRWTRKCRVRMHAILIAIDAETQALMSTAAPQALRHGRLLHMLLAALHSMLSPQRTTCGTVTPGTPSKPRFKGYVASTTYAATHKHTHTHAFCTHATSILACTNTHYLQLSAKCMQLPIHSYYSYESYSQRPRRRAPRPRAAAAHLGGTPSGHTCAAAPCMCSGTLRQSSTAPARRPHRPCRATHRQADALQHPSINTARMPHTTIDMWWLPLHPIATDQMHVHVPSASLSSSAPCCACMGGAAAAVRPCRPRQRRTSTAAAGRPPPAAAPGRGRASRGWCRRWPSRRACGRGRSRWCPPSAARRGRTAGQSRHASGRLRRRSAALLAAPNRSPAATHACVGVKRRKLQRHGTAKKYNQTKSTHNQSKRPSFRLFCNRNTNRYLYYSYYIFTLYSLYVHPILSYFNYILIMCSLYIY